MPATAMLKRIDLAASDPIEYQISRETEERVRSARVRQVLFQARQILERGGYHAKEVDSVMEVLMPFVRSGRPIPRDEVLGALRKRSFSKADAELLADAFARRD